MRFVSPVALITVGPALAGARLFRFDGRLHVAAFAKTRLTFVSGEAMIATAPPDIQLLDAVDPASGVGVAASDAVPFRPGADIVVVGRPRPAPFGARGPQRKPRLAVASPRDVGGRLEGSSTVIDKSGAVSELAPIPNSDPSRRGLIPVDARTRVDRPMPELWTGVDFRYFHAAPQDQRAPFLRGDEWVYLEQLHPGYEGVSSQLPMLKPIGRIQIARGSEQPVTMRIDTLTIDAGSGFCDVVARGSFAVAADSDLQWITLVLGFEIGKIKSVAQAPAPRAAAPAPIAPPAPPAPVIALAQPAKNAGTMLIEPPESNPGTMLLAAPDSNPGTMLLTAPDSNPGTMLLAPPDSNPGTMILQPGEAAPPAGRSRESTMLIEPENVLAAALPFANQRRPPPPAAPPPPAHVLAAVPPPAVVPATVDLDDLPPPTVMPSSLESRTAIFEAAPATRAPFRVMKPGAKPRTKAEIPGSPWASKAAPRAQPVDDDLGLHTMDAAADPDASLADAAKAAADAAAAAKRAAAEKEASAQGAPRSSKGGKVKDPWRKLPQDQAPAPKAPKAPAPKVGIASPEMKKSLYDRFKKS